MSKNQLVKINKDWRSQFDYKFKRGLLKYDEGGSVGSVISGMIPLYGTYQDIKTAYHNPTLENIGWAIASGIGDALFFTGAGAGIKSLKLLNQTRKAKKLLETKRRVTALTAQNNFKNTVMNRILDKASPTDVVRARTSAKQTRANYQNALNKYKQSSSQVYNQTRQLGKNFLQNLKRDGIIQSIQEISKLKED